VVGDRYRVTEASIAMSAALYVVFLLVLFTVPLLVRWRWGFLACLFVTVATLGLIVLVFHLMDTYHLLRSPRGPMPEQGQLEYLRQGMADGYVLVIALVLIPGAVLLIGWGVAAVWSALAFVRSYTQ
jgi:hypothetical protein